jgi:aryl-alcohol dehydrogenase-like predicted oxidoreductase
MRTVTLGQTGLTTSILGYGCAGLMRPATTRERSALLETAFDSGIRHFDVARYYGHGGAEEVLGRFVSEGNRRDEVTIATKFGIQPTSLGHSSFGKRIMSSARWLASIHPQVRKVLSKLAGGTVRTNRFDQESARLSLETSLRELRTDRIDLFLLHDANLEDARTPGLLEFLEAAKQDGKIRAFGSASGYSETLDIILHAPLCASVVQIANGFGQWNLARLPANPSRFVITHGALKILPVLERGLRGAESTAGEGEFPLLSSMRGMKLAGLLLGFAMHENRQGITLFSSTQPRRIRDNITKSLEAESFSSEDWSILRRAIKQQVPAIDVH